MKLKLIEIVALNNALFVAGQQAIPFKGAYAIARNFALTKDLTETFEKLRIAMAEKHAEKDAQGAPLIVNNQYVFADVAAFELEFCVLREQEEDVRLYVVKPEDMYNAADEKAAKILLSPATITALFPMFEPEKKE